MPTCRIVCQAAKWYHSYNDDLRHGRCLTIVHRRVQIGYWTQKCLCGNILLLLCQKIIVTHRLELQEWDLFVNARGAFTLVHHNPLFSNHLSTSCLFVGSQRRRRPSGLLRVMVSRSRLTANRMLTRVRLLTLLAVF